MKRLLFAFLAGIVMMGITSCGETTTTTTPVKKELDLSATRGAKAEAQTISVDRFAANQISTKDLENLEIIVVKKAAEDAQQDAAAAASLMQSFMTAQTNAQLDIEFAMSDEPIENGVFLFSMDSDTQRDLEFEMFDEEGFGMAANNTVHVNSGKNYKALNVTELDNGTYIFRLKDDEGKELVRNVEINNK